MRIVRRLLVILLGLTLIAFAETTKVPLKTLLSAGLDRGYPALR